MGVKKFVVNGMATEKEKIKYPKSVFFIVSNEFCERFSYYGMRTILSLYLIYVLQYSEPEAKILYHLFTMFVYFFPVFGAIIADSWLGKFRTIFYLSCIYAVGNIVLSLAATGPLQLPQREISILGLMLIAIGTGGIKPCVSAFGGDQFTLPQQQDQLAKFFSLFYFAINAGSLISTLLTPILREEVHCFGEEHCFPVAFGVPGALMIIAIVVFVVGKPKYNIKKPEGNVIVSVSKCISHAIARKIKDKSGVKRQHWLDHASDTYDSGLIEDIKATLKVLWLYLPIPVFWALFDQQGTGWTFQATRMSGDIGVVTILPDQMQVVNPLLILAFIPLFDTCIYPVLGRCRLLRTPLQRLTVGGLLAAVAFCISGFVEMKLEDTYPVLPSAGQAQLRIYNSLPCNISLNGEHFSESLSSMTQFQKMDLPVTGTKTFSYDMVLEGDCPVQIPAAVTFEVREKTMVAQMIAISQYGNVTVESFKDDVQKSSNGYPLVRTLVNTLDGVMLPLLYKGSDGTERVTSNTSSKAYKALSKITPDTYKVYVNYTYIADITLKLGGVYSVLIDFTGKESSVKLFTISEPNSIHIMWLIPQYLVLTMAEIMFSVTGLEFSYSQAPVSMKSVLQAGWLLTTAFGNLLVVIIEELKAFDSQSLQYFLYAGLMVVDMGVFALMAMSYKYVNEEDQSEQNSVLEDMSARGDDGQVMHKVDEKKGIENMSYKHDEAL